MIKYVHGNIFKNNNSIISYEYHSKPTYYTDTQDTIISKYYLEYNDLLYLIKDYRMSVGDCYYSKHLIHMIMNDGSDKPEMQYMNFFENILKKDNISDLSFPRLGMEYGKGFEMDLYKKIEFMFKKSNKTVFIYNDHIDFLQGQIYKVVN